MVFQSQLDAVERPTPRERIGSGKISPITIQALRMLVMCSFRDDMVNLPWTPGRCEEEDEDGDEGNLRVNSGDIVGDWITIRSGVSVIKPLGDPDDGNEEL